STREERAGVYDSMNAALARLHGIDVAAAGLSDYGKPGNYFARQWQRSRERDERNPGDAPADRLARRKHAARRWARRARARRLPHRQHDLRFDFAPPARGAGLGA